MSRVFLIAQPTVKRNGSLPKLEQLSQYGEVIVITLAGDSPTFQPRRCFANIRRRLLDRSYSPASDYLVWAGGDTLAAVMTGVVLAELLPPDHTGSIRWLRWERARRADGSRSDTEGTYVPVDVPLPYLDGDDHPHEGDDHGPEDEPAED